jgi:hypothetical protein
MKTNIVILCTVLLLSVSLCFFAEILMDPYTEMKQYKMKVRIPDASFSYYSFDCDSVSQNFAYIDKKKIPLPSIYIIQPNK